MISVTDLRSGAVFEEQGQIYQVLSYEHIKMGRGSATIKVKVKNIKTGSTTEKGFMNGAKVVPITIVKRQLQFLYKDADTAYFMDLQSFEQTGVPLKNLTNHKFFREGDTYSVNFLEDEPLSVSLPSKMDYKVIETGPSTKGNSAVNVFKDATLENGIKTKVPLFIKTGDMIKIDTRDGVYTEKA